MNISVIGLGYVGLSTALTLTDDEFIEVHQTLDDLLRKLPKLKERIPI